MTIVTRFAPSPTGHLHIGGARTAIFSWLLAKHAQGKFILRIEDTDTERSMQEYTDSILSSMNWLGLNWDGELIYQSQRFELYSEYIENILASGHAYYCECSPEEVEAMREEARQKGEKPAYNGKCRNRNLAKDSGRVVRLKTPLEGEISFNDMIKGKITVAAKELDDMILQRADGAVTYNFAVVVDDYTMGVSHVMRGDDHVNNTPRQILIYEALGLSLPIFGHVPMILGSDKQKLSKRHGAKAVIDYQADGILPEALLNYLVRLSWSHGDQEIFSREELIEFFDGKKFSNSAASFDPEKLLWVNAQHLHKLPIEKLAELLQPFLERLKLNPTKDLLKKTIPLFQTRSNSLVTLAEQLKVILCPTENLDYAPQALLKAFNESSKAHLTKLIPLFASLEEFNKQNIHAVLQGFIADNGLKFKEVAPALRVALLGSLGGPDLSDTMEVLGKEESLKRCRKALLL